MKILTILGSPRKKGNTAKVLGWVEDELRSMGHDVERVDIIDHKVNGCISCYKCFQHPDSFYCSQKDDAIPIFKKAIKSDAMILSSPLYCWQFSSFISALMERSISLVKYSKNGERTSYVANKPIGMLLTCAGPKEKNADTVQTVFKREANHLAMRHAGMLIIPGCSEPDSLGDNVKEKAIKYARKFK